MAQGNLYSMTISYLRSGINVDLSLPYLGFVEFHKRKENFVKVGIFYSFSANTGERGYWTQDRAYGTHGV